VDQRCDKERTAVATRGFRGRSRPDPARVPPGQYAVGRSDYPILTAGGTEEIDRDDWRLTVSDGIVSRDYDWDGLHALGAEAITVDIHCVTHWSKLDTTWGGVRLATIFDDAGLGDLDHALVTSYGGYTTNVPTVDLTDHDAIVATSYDGGPIEAEHGGPVRLLVPHLYLWKSAKWLREIRLSDSDDPGFWEVAGYHNYGDPWREQRYYSD
jgi:DMSO/TMAO reductase YedYZ molybdopterin-dependent catalytic subunit